MNDLETRSLGTSGLRVSRVGIGCNAFGTRIDAEQTQRVVDAALEEGVTLFDTADSYGAGISEELLGKALGKRRSEVVVATKFGMDVGGSNGPDWGATASRRYIRTAVENSLRRLGTDYIDLYQLHRRDGITPLEETLDAMSDLVTEGKVRYLGSSNLAAWEVVDADWTARTRGTQRFVSAQNEYSLYNRSAEQELVPACASVGVGILPYFPLAYGLLTGKYARGEDAPSGSRLESQSQRLADADWDKVDALRSFADERGIDMLDVAMGGLAAQPGVASVIAGVTSPAQVASNVRAGAWRPSPEDRERLAQINVPDAPGYTSFALR